MRAVFVAMALFGLLAGTSVANAQTPQPRTLGERCIQKAGGTFEGTNAARMDSWPKALAFLRTNLAGKGCAPLR